MNKRKYKKLWSTAMALGRTSSILSIENNSLTFARNNKYLSLLLNTDKMVHVIVPNNIDKNVINNLPSNITTYVLDAEDDIGYIFTYIHNEINKDREPKPNIISSTANIHSTAIIGVHGNTYCKCPDGSMINLKHMGNVVIEDDVDIEALAIVHRAGMTSTILKRGVKICVQVNIGHNCVIGEDTFIASGALIGGSATIGKNCYIWQGAIIRDNVSICDNVIIGSGSMVMHNITDPGVYFGSPAKYIKFYDPLLR